MFQTDVFHTKDYVRSLGYGPELPEFPYKVGQMVTNDHTDARYMTMIDEISITYCRDGGGFKTLLQLVGLGPVCPGMYGNVFSSEEEMNASHKYFYRIGRYLPDRIYFNPRPCANMEKPPAPYFVYESNFAITKWYFGIVELAPERPGNTPYQCASELRKEATGKFVWVEDLESGLEFFCHVCLYFSASATNCSLYYPYRFEDHEYALTNDFYGKKRPLHPWVARARPKRGDLYGL